MINNKKVIYETMWVARDEKKEYPHGWGFDAPFVEFPQDADPAWCVEMCKRNLSNEEFECIGATVSSLLDGVQMLNYPTSEKEWKEWQLKRQNQV